jgi:predicted Rdx family selenoprotein
MCTVFGTAGGLFGTFGPVDHLFRVGMAAETAAFFAHQAGGRQATWEPNTDAGFENTSRLKSVVHRVDRLHGDFQGRLLPKWERMLAFIHILASEWWHT